MLYDMDLSYIVGGWLDFINISRHIGPNALVIHRLHSDFSHGPETHTRNSNMSYIIRNPEIWLIFSEKKCVVFTRQDGNYCTSWQSNSFHLYDKFLENNNPDFKNISHGSISSAWHLSKCNHSIQLTQPHICCLLTSSADNSTKVIEQLPSCLVNTTLSCLICMRDLKLKNQEKKFSES